VVGTVARTAVIAGTATAVSHGVSGRMDSRAQQKQQAQAEEQDDVQALQQQVAELQAQQAQAAVGPAPEAPAGGEDMITQLKQLGDLKSAGLLTDAEFEAAKARVLGT
jgi:hypothetical protein